MASKKKKAGAVAPAGKKPSSPGPSKEVAFFELLWDHYQTHRSAIRANYNELTKRFLDFNDKKKNPKAFLREPQFQALEMYVYLKERLDNRPVHEIFELWYHKEHPFKDRVSVGTLSEAQPTLPNVIEFDEATYKVTFERMKAAGDSIYSNYIFALTMGTGKTILMGTCIFYDFLLARKYPKDPRYVHNALVFAPDKTVLTALREMQTFDRSKVVPPDYVNVLDTMMTFHFLEDAGTTLDVIENSEFNLIISNTQKIIRKRQNKPKSPQEKLFQGTAGAFTAAHALYDFDTIDPEELSTNQRYEKLCRLEQLGVYIDEAHHAFGSQLERDLLRKKTAGEEDDDSKTSLRRTVDLLASALKKKGTRVVACFCYTGTPYAKGIIFPEVVYAFGLKQAIDAMYLKKVVITGYTNPKTSEFVKEVLTDFFKKHPPNARYEGMKPKIAFFAATIEDVNDELRPAVEKTLAKLGLPTDIINVNVGDSDLTTNDDIREFNKLDTPSSDKQVILLVNKGKEGWNCRSLFGVALYRKPKSRVFVLQATMRCLRAIACPPQQTGHVYLSEENLQLLDEELSQNFRLGVDDMNNAGSKKKLYEVHTVPPPRKVKLKRISQVWQNIEREPGPGVAFDFVDVNFDKYRLMSIHQEGITFDDAARAARVEKDLSATRERRSFSELTLVAEIARYLNMSPVKIDDVLRTSKEGIAEVLKRVNEFNEVLYDHVIPKLFSAFITVKSYQSTKEEDVLLVHEPAEGFFSILADPADVVEMADAHVAAHNAKSFHLDMYSFDSSQEKKLFLELLPHNEVKCIYFTGMLTHGQSDFFIEYIDPESHTLRTYYPDFLIETVNGDFIIVEVKADHMIHDPTVEAKTAAAEQIATATGKMTYRIIAASAVPKGTAKLLFGPILPVVAPQPKLALPI